MVKQKKDGLEGAVCRCCVSRASVALVPLRRSGRELETKLDGHDHHVCKQEDAQEGRCEVLLLSAFRVGLPVKLVEPEIFAVDAEHRENSTEDVETAESVNAAASVSENEMTASTSAATAATSVNGILNRFGGARGVRCSCSTAQ